MKNGPLGGILWEQDQMSIDAIGSVSRLSSTLDVDKHFMLGSHKAIKALRSLENGFKHLNLAVKHVLL